MQLYDRMSYASAPEPNPERRFWRAMRWSLGIPLGLLFVAIVATAALAQEAEDKTVGIDGFVTVIWPWVEYGAAAGIALMVGWGASLWTRLSGRQLDEAHRTALNAALKTGAVNALSKVRERIDDARFEVDNDTVREVLRYANASVPDALGWLRPSPDVLEAKAKAALVEAAAQLGKPVPAEAAA